MHKADTPHTCLRNPIRAMIGLAVLSLAALILRVLFLDRASLWGDEILFVGLSRPTDSLADIYQRMLAGFHVVTHLPFPLMVQNLFMRAFGGNSPDMLINSFLQRLPAVLWGTASVPAIYCLTRKRLPSLVAWMAAAWMALGIFPVYYSREAYFYAPLMTLAACTLHNWLTCVERLSENKTMPKWAVLWFIIASTGMVYSHLTGMLFQAGLVLMTCVLVLLPRTTGLTRWRMGVLTLLSMLPFLFLSPFVHSLVTKRNEAGIISGTPMPGICWDVLGKFFMGHLLVLNILAALIFILGLYGLWRMENGNRTSRLMVLLCATMLLMIVYSSHKSQYHVRYFSVIAPLLIVTFTSGVWLVAGILGRYLPTRIADNNRIFIALMSGILLFNLLVQPIFYMLTARSTDYRSAADWINRNVEPGGAYLLESGYELRFVGGYFATPERLGMCPYIHGDVEILHKRQQDLLMRYPDIPWIENSRHGYQPGMLYGNWTWPHQFFRSTIRIENQSALLLERFRIGMDYLGRSHINSKSFHIWRNTRDDIKALDVEAGRSCSLFYPGWRFVTVQQEPRGMWAEYARFYQGTSAPLEAANNTGKEVRAALSLQLALATQRTDPITLELAQGSEILGKWELSAAGGQFMTLKSRDFSIPSEGVMLRLRVASEHANGLQGILVYSATVQ